MPKLLPDYLNISAAELGRGQPVTVHVTGDVASLARAMAEDILQEIVQKQREARHSTLIVPVDPWTNFLSWRD